MNRMKLLAPLFLLPLASSCVAPDDGSATDDPSAKGSSPEVSAASDTARADGLELTANTDDHVAGRFTRDHTTISFDLDKQGDDMHVLVRSAAGAALIDSHVQKGGTHTTRVLDGRLVVNGTPEAMPTYEGDRTAEKELHDMPEGAVIGALEAALAAAQVKPGMIPTVHVHGTAEAVGYGNCNTWVPDGGYATCGSVFLGWTSIHVENCTPYYASYLITSALDGTAGAPGQGFYNMGPGAPPYYCPIDDHSGWWWGANVTFQWGSHYYWAGWTPTQVGGQSLYFGH